MDELDPVHEAGSGDGQGDQPELAGDGTEVHAIIRAFVAAAVEHQARMAAA